MLCKYYIFKTKAGFLVNEAIDTSIFGKDDSIHIATAIVEKENSPFFMFLHISGLDIVGQEEGWMSKECLEEFKFIDDDLEKIINILMNKKKVTLIVTSDHAGHSKEHKTQHPEDFRVPLIVYSNITDYSYLKNGFQYYTFMLRDLVKKNYR